MPKGAFSKGFAVNGVFKAEVRKAAQQQATLQAGPRHLQWCVPVRSSALEGERKQQCCEDIKDCVRKFERGMNPLSGLNTPPRCKACAGQKGGTHHFLCEKRQRLPGAEERVVRDRVRHIIAEDWRAHVVNYV